MIIYYEQKDIEQVANIITEDWKIAYKGIIDDEYLENLDYKDKEKSIREKYQKQKSIVLDEEGIVKGYSRFGENRDEEKDLAELYALYVKADERGKKIGEKLLRKTADILSKRGYKEMVIWCLKENKNARKFYEKMGGKIYKTRNIEIENKKYGEVCYKYDLEKCKE